MMHGECDARDEVGRETFSSFFFFSSSSTSMSIASETTVEGDSTDAASMSAKIARLTGVVRRLHAACERGERERERAVEAFARDVALTRSEASCAVLRETAARERAEEETRARVAAGAVREAKTRACVEETVMRGEMERRAAVETMRRECEERERARERECGMKIADAKAACERRREATERARVEALEREREARERIVRHAEAVERELKSELEFERCERARIEDAFERELERERERRAAAVAEVNAAANAREEREREQESARALEMEACVKRCEEKISCERATAREKYERQRSAYEFLEKSLAETESELECTRRAHEACRRTLEEATTNLTDRESALARSRTELADGAKSADAMREEIDRLRALVGESADELTRARDSHATSVSERARLEETLQSERNDREAFVTEHEEKVRELEEQVRLLKQASDRGEREAASAAKDSDEKLKSLLDELDKRSKKVEAERQELISSYESRIKAMDLEHEARRAALSSEYAERERTIESESERGLSAVDASWRQKEMKWVDTQRRMQESVDCLTLREKQANELAQMYEARNHALASELERLKTDIDAREKCFTDQVRKLKLTEHALEALTHKLERQLSEQVMESESARIAEAKSFQDETARLNALWERKTKENIEFALERSNTEHEHALARLTEDMDLKAKAEVARAVANVSEAYHTNERELREEIDALNREHARQTVEMTASHENQLRALREDYDGRLESVTSAHSDELERMTNSHAECVGVLQKEHEKHVKQSMSEAVRLAVREVEAQHEVRSAEMMEKATTSAEAELKRATEEHSKEMEQLDREYGAKIESCIAVSAALELERETLRGQLRRVREEFCTLEMQRATDNDRSKEAAAATAYAHENEIETLRKEHKSVVARMQDVNESAARTANEALAASNAETAKWRAMYDKRESRPEDLRRIKELQNDLHETTARLERSVAHRRTLQSELMGRAAEFDSPSARGARLSRARAAYAIGR